MSLLEKLQAHADRKATAPVKSSDATRIRDLPRRDYTPEFIENLVRTYTQRLRRPEGTMSLRPIQAIALHEAATYGGILGFIPTGAGKSLTSLLLPMVVPNCKVAVLLMPPQLKTKTVEADYPTLSKHWRLPSLGDSVFVPGAPKLYPVAYTEIQTARKADILDRIKPDLIVADEAHSIVRKSVRTGRVMRYFKVNQTTHFVAMSGTLITRSIKDAATLSRVALRYNTPFPLDFMALESWAEALDPKDEDEDAWSDEPTWRTEATLKEIRDACGGDGPGGDSLRSAFNRRLVATPGVIATSAKRECDAGLEFHERPLELDPVVKDALLKLRREWAIGDEELEDATALSRAAKQLAAGMYTRWIWPRREPLALRKEWLGRRADWHREIRATLAHGGKAGLDSPLLLARAAEAGTWRSDAYKPWKEIEPKCAPEPDVVWVSDYMIKDAAAWGRKHVGIIWTYHQALGPKIAKELGAPYYGTVDDSAEFLKERGERTIVCSANAYATGFDMPWFNKQLITTPTSNPARWQQLLARTHRSGQKADVIETYVYTHTPELVKALEDGISGARFLAEITKEEQLLLLATHSWR